MRKSRLIAIHLLNDLSGSPFVFRQALDALTTEYEVHLFTATPSGRGFLSNLRHVAYHNIPYRYSRNKWIRFIYFGCSQLMLVVRLLFFVRSRDIVYINTMLPFGAALAGKIKGCAVIYHIHEISVRPLLLKRWLLWVIQQTASHCIYVSAYLKRNCTLKVKGSVVYNALPETFGKQAEQAPRFSNQPFTVLMLCSLREYKGVLEILACARQAPGMKFKLVLNATQEEIGHFFQKTEIPVNLSLYAAQADVHTFYQTASVVVNLSRPAQWIETFGMTILEAMYYRKPVLIPGIGGITELVDDGISGYHVDSGDTIAVVERLLLLSNDPVLYERMSEASFQRAFCFTELQFRQGIIKCINMLSRNMPVANKLIAGIGQ